MKKMLSLIVIELLGLSLFSMSTPWTVKAQEILWNTNPTLLPNPITNHMSIIHKCKIYIISGAIGHDVDWFEVPDVYFGEVDPDGTVGSWITTTSLPQNRTHARAVVWNGFVYVIGGYCSKYTEPGPRLRGEKDTVYYAQINPDGSLRDWKTTTPLPDAFSEHGAVAWDGKIYVLGGWNGYSRKNEVYYAEINADGSIDEWYTTTRLPLKWSSMGAIVRDSTIYIIGGVNGSGGTTSNSVYYAFINPDGTLGTWSKTTSLPKELSYVRAVLDGDDIYVVGGYWTDFPSEKVVYKATIESDGTIGAWKQLQSIPEGRSLHSLVTFQGRIYVIGGEDEGRNAKDTIYYSPLARAESAGLPFWMEWYFWVIITLGTATSILAFSTFRYRRRAHATKKEPTATTVTMPISKKEYKVCPKCGAHLPTDSIFCGKCGTSLK